MCKANLTPFLFSRLNQPQKKHNISELKEETSNHPHIVQVFSIPHLGMIPILGRPLSGFHF